MALLDSLVSALLNSLRKFFAPLTKLWDKLVLGWTHLTNIGKDTQTLISSVQDEISAWRNFREDTKWKSKVISVPIAYDKTKQFIENIPAAWRAVADLVSSLKEKITSGGSPETDAEEFAADIQSGEGVSSFLKRLPRLVKGLERLFGFVAIVVDALETIANTIADLQTIVGEIGDIRREIESQETIFLSQKNKRRTVTTNDGRKIQERIGVLHGD